MFYGSSNSAITLPDTVNTCVNYIKRRLGEPAIQINLSNSHFYDRIADAFQFFRDYNEDGTEELFVAHEITEETISNGYIPVANNVFEVVRVMQPMQIDKNILTDITYNIRHQLNFSEFMWSAYTGAFTEYSLLMMKIQEITDMFQPAKAIRFNPYTRKLYWNEDMRKVMEVGMYVCYQAHVVVDPEEHGRIFSDRRFLNLATAYVKRNWGEVLSKFSNVPLFGGMKLDGQRIYQEAIADIEKAEQDIINSAKPARDMIG